MLRILNQDDMASRTVDLSAAADETEEAVKKLEDLKQELEGIASRVATVAKVIQGIDDAIAVAKACFGLRKVDSRLMYPEANRRSFDSNAQKQRVSAQDDESFIVTRMAPCRSHACR